MHRCRGTLTAACTLKDPCNGSPATVLINALGQDALPTAQHQPNGLLIALQRSMPLRSIASYMSHEN